MRAGEAPHITARQLTQMEHTKEPLGQFESQNLQQLLFFPRSAVCIQGGSNSCRVATYWMEAYS